MNQQYNFTVINNVVGAHMVVPTLENILQQQIINKYKNNNE